MRPIVGAEKEPQCNVIFRTNIRSLTDGTSTSSPRSIHTAGLFTK